MTWPVIAQIVILTIFFIFVLITFFMVPCAEVGRRSTLQVIEKTMRDGTRAWYIQRRVLWFWVDALEFCGYYYQHLAFDKLETATQYYQRHLANQHIYKQKKVAKVQVIQISKP